MADQYKPEEDGEDISPLSMRIRGRPNQPQIDTYVKKIRSAFSLLAHTKVSADSIDYVEQGVPETRYFPSMVALQLYLTGDFAVNDISSDGNDISPGNDEYVEIDEKTGEENEERKKMRLEPAFKQLMKVTQKYDDWLESKLFPPKQAGQTTNQSQAPAKRLGNDFQINFTYVYDTILYRVLISRFACDDLVMHRVREHNVLRQLLEANKNDIANEQTKVSHAVKAENQDDFKKALGYLVQYVNGVDGLYDKFKQLATPPPPLPDE